MTTQPNIQFRLSAHFSEGPPMHTIAEKAAALMDGIKEMVAAPSDKTPVPLGKEIAIQRANKAFFHLLDQFDGPEGLAKEFAALDKKDYPEASDQLLVFERAVEGDVTIKIHREVLSS